MPPDVLPKNLPPPSQLQPRDSAWPPSHLSGSPDAPRPAPRPHPRSSLHLRSWAGTRVPGPLCLSSPATPPAQTSAPTTCPSRALTRPRLSSRCCVFSPHLRRRGHQPSAPGAGDGSTLTSHLSVTAAVTAEPASARPGPQVHKFASLLSQAGSKPRRISLPPGTAAPDGLHCPPPTRLSGGWESRWCHVPQAFSGSCCTEVAARPWPLPARGCPRHAA